MPRRPRSASGNYVYHVLNRAVGRNTIFESDGDYAAFLRVIEEAEVKKGSGVFSPSFGCVNIRLSLEMSSDATCY